MVPTNTNETNGGRIVDRLFAGFYDHHRAAGDTHHQALRALGNRLVGILHGCLRHHTAYNEDTAWAHRQTTHAA